MKTRLRSILFYLFLLWSLFALIFFCSKNTIEIGHIVRSGIFLVFLAAASFGAGRVMAKLFKLKTITFIEQLCVSIGLGLGAIYVLCMIMDLLGLLRVPSLIIAAFIMLALSAKSIARWGSDFFQKWRLYSGNRFSFMGASFLIVIVVCAGALYINTLVPAVGEYGMTGSLAQAKSRIMQGNHSAVAFGYESRLPSAMATLQSLGFLISGQPAARQVSFLYLMLLSAGIYSMTRRFFHRKIALYATAITLTTPGILRLFLNDHPYTASIFYAFMALYSFICWSGSTRKLYDKNDGWLIVSGIFTAFSLSFGLYTMFTAMVLTAMVSFRTITSSDEDKESAMISKLGYFMTAFTIALIPLMLRNMVLSGNPIFPFFSDLADVGYIKSVWGKLFPLWNIPFEESMKFSNFYYLGLIYFIFLPGILLVRELGRTIRLIIIYIVIYFIVYILAGRRAVFVYAIVPVLSILTAYVIVNLYGQRKYFYQFVTFIFFFSIVINMYSILPWMGVSDKLLTAVGIKPSDKYLEEKIKGYDVYRYINEDLPAESRIFLVADTRTLYIDRDTLSADSLSADPFVSLAKKYKTAGKLQSELKEMGVTHVLVNRAGILNMRKYRSSEWDRHVDDMYSIFVSGYLDLEYEGKEHILYELRGV